MDGQSVISKVRAILEHVITMIVSHKHKFIFLKTKKTGGSSIRMMLAQLLNEDDYILTPAHVAEDFELRKDKVYPQNFMNPEVIPFWKDERSYEIGSPAELLKFRKELGFRKSDAIQHFFLRAHATCDQVRDFVGDQVYKNYFKFAFDRNPFDRMVSLYNWRLRDDPLRINKRPAEISFDEFVSRRFNHQRTCNSRIYCSNGELAIDHLARFEDFSGELKFIFHQIGIPFDTKRIPRIKSGKRKLNYRDYYSFEMTKDKVRSMHATCMELLNYEF
jgi:hypothetical protein